MPNYTNSVWSETVPTHVHGGLEGDLEVDVAIIGGGITGITAMSGALEHHGEELGLPCHGSRFDPQGKVLNGPATSSLEPKAVPSADASKNVPSRGS